jgi:mRNA interferase MazF
MGGLRPRVWVLSRIVRPIDTDSSRFTGSVSRAGLLKPSVLKPLLATIEKGLVLRKLGRLEEEDRRALREVLDAILGA